MSYNTCPTCGYFLGGITKNFEDEKEKICNNPKLSNSEIESKMKDLIMSLPLRRYCCRMRIMTYKDLVRELVPVSNSS